MSITNENARQVVISTVEELCKDRPEGVFGAALGLELSRRGFRQPHRQLGYLTLREFIDSECQDRLVVTQGSKDIVVNLRDSSDHPAAHVRPQAPRLQKAPAGAAPRIQSDLWAAALHDVEDIFYDTVEHRVVKAAGGVIDGGILSPPRYLTIPALSVKRQREVLAEVQASIPDFVSSGALRDAIEKVTCRAIDSAEPFRSLTEDLGAIGQLWRAWTHRRVRVVQEHLEGAGIDVEAVQASSATTQHIPPDRRRGFQSRDNANPADSSQDRSSDEPLRNLVIRAISRMPLDELLRLAIPLRDLAPDLALRRQ